MAGAISYINEGVFYRGRRNLGEVTAFFNKGTSLHSHGPHQGEGAEPRALPSRASKPVIALSDRRSVRSTRYPEGPVALPQRARGRDDVTDMDLRALK